MKILKVVVDKISKNCKECVYSSWNSFSDRYCQAALRIIYDDNTRPDWCPLVTVLENAREIVEEYLQMTHRNEE